MEIKIKKTQIFQSFLRSLETKKGIFKILLIGKLIFLPFLVIAYGFIDSRPQNIFFHGDLETYENYSLMNSPRNIGFILIANIFKITFGNETFKLLIYGVVALFLMCYVQTEILNVIFEEKKLIDNKFKLASIFLSITNFYILIYSFKPGTDIFNCLGITIFFCGLIKINKLRTTSNYLIWLFKLLIISLFRNTIFLPITYLVFTDFRKVFIKEIKKITLNKRFFYLTIITFLIIINLYQLRDNLFLFLSVQEQKGLNFDLNSLNSFSKAIQMIFQLFSNIFLKFIHLISARDVVSVSSNWLVTEFRVNKSINPYLSNIIPALFLFSINFLGLISIYKKFSKDFKRYFSYSLVGLLPLISYYAHHRYFLPYSIFTTACLPFLFERKST